MIDKNFLRNNAIKMGIELSDIQLEQFNTYAQNLVEYNDKVNLTSITDPKDIVIKHFIDSIAPQNICSIVKNASLADVGTGAGFPSMALKIIRPDLKITMIDSLAKRITFLDMMSKLLGQDNKTVHSRAEQAGIDQTLRESFDIVTARAVANLRVLCEYCLPLVKVGGFMMAFKGKDCDLEVEQALNAINILGGQTPSSIQYTLPDNSNRTLIIINKISSTPKKYPRQRIKLSDKPL